MLAVKVARGAPVPFCHEGRWLWAPSDGHHSRCCWQQLTAPSAHPPRHVHRGGGGLTLTLTCKLQDDVIPSFSRRTQGPGRWSALSGVTPCLSPQVQQGWGLECGSHLLGTCWPLSPTQPSPLSGPGLGPREGTPRREGLPSWGVLSWPLPKPSTTSHMSTTSWDRLAAYQPTKPMLPLRGLGGTSRNPAAHPQKHKHG